MKKSLIISAFALTACLAGCTDWLKNTPNYSQRLEDDVYSSELGTYSVLNGLYTEIVSSNLYGEKLSITAIEMMARYYDFPTNLNNRRTERNMLTTFSSQWNYTTEDELVRKYFAGVWNKAYSTILKINTFIDNVNSSDVMGTERRNVALGEAYGLRALLHMDIYRLYGPMVPTDTEILLPYNKIPGVNIVGSLTASQYLEFLMDDIEIAVEYLKSDPIIAQERILDQPDDNSLMTTEQKSYVLYRNYRLNYYAANLLKIRVLMLQEKFDEVDQVADLIIDEAVDHTYTNAQYVKNNVFALTPSNTHIKNLIFYDEMLFGAHNFDQYNNWRANFNTGEITSDLLVSNSNLRQNIYGISNDINLSQTDIRGRQWVPAPITGTKGEVEELGYYISNKNSGSEDSYSYSASDARQWMMHNSISIQPLCRLSEVYYAKAEAHLRMDDGVLNTAIECINTILASRGFQASTGNYSTQAQLPPGATKEQVKEMLWREYYREFFLEGQTFYFLKRNGYTETIKGNGPGMSEEITPAKYVVPKPDSEVNYF